MSDMIEVKTAELIGPALDWAVAKIEGVNVAARMGAHPVGSPLHGRYYLAIGDLGACFAPSIDWRQGGLLRDKYRVAVYDVDGIGGGKVAATLREHPEHWIDESGFDAGATADTALVAICRAIVAAKLGETVQIPACLVKP